MKKLMLYRHCRLVKRLRDGEKVLMTYIPAEYASENRHVKVQDDDGHWEDDWTIRVVGRTVTEDQITEMSIAHRRFQRETSKD